MSRTRRIGLAPFLFLALLPGAGTDASDLRDPSASVPPPRRIVAGDFNADFQPDVLLETARGNLVVWLMEGLKPTARVTNPARRADQGWRAVGTHDFDGDGNTDILWFHPRNGVLAVWHMDGLNLQYESELSERFFDAVPVSIFDFNRDNHPDILFQTTQGELVVGILVGNDVVEKVRLDLAWQGSRGSLTAIGAADFDQDGDFDIVLHHRGFSPCEAGSGCTSAARSDLVAVALMNGTRSKIVVVSEQQDRNWRIGAVSDYDGDSNPDLIWYNTLTHETAAWRMEGLKIRQSLIIVPGAPGVIVGPR